MLDQTTQSQSSSVFAKCATGIKGLDEITGGGLPRGRPTLVCGSAGSGKTLLAIEFLARGALEFDEPGVFMSFEETSDELIANVRSLGFDLDKLVHSNKLAMDYVHIERNEIEETGEYDLDGLFVRLDYAINSVGAKRVVLDTIEALFAGLSNTGILRGELRRLFRWLKSKSVTAVITGERGTGQLTRHGLEEYVSDCVLLLDHRVTEQVSTRRLRVVKYRGTIHGTNEYPFLIDEHGISVLPITSLALEHEASSERVSTGIARLDSMLSGGYYRGSAVLVSGTAGTGKTSLAACFADTACRRGERCLYFAFEESQSQVCRNMRSIGIDLAQWIGKGLLSFHASRPTILGLELHLTTMYKAVNAFRPDVVIIDPITNFLASGEAQQAMQMVVRLVDLLKSKNVTTLFTSLTGAGEAIEQSEIGISSQIDTWLLLRVLETNGERNRGLYVLKSRGMAHSNQIREFLLSDQGIELVDVFVGSEGVLAGSSRLAQEFRLKADEVTRQHELERRKRVLEHKRRAAEAQIATILAGLQVEEDDTAGVFAEQVAAGAQVEQVRVEISGSRWADK